MIRCYRASRICFCLGLLLTAALAVFVGQRRAGGPIWIFAITVFLVIALGVTVSLLCANLLAQQRQQRLLSQLYVDLDPEGFLKGYTGVPEKLKKPAARMMAERYLADGCCAAGRYDEALAALQTAPVSKDPQALLALTLLQCDSRAHCLLQKGDAAQAGAAMAEYRVQLELSKKNAPKLYRNMCGSYAGFSQELRLLENAPVDAAAVKAMMEETKILIRRFELQLLLSKAYLQENRRDQAVPLLQEIAEKAPGMALGREAAGLLTAIR